MAEGDPPDPPPSSDEVFSQFQDIFRDFFGGVGPPGAPGSARGPMGDVALTLPLTRAEAARGVERAVEVPRWTPCTFCEGTGGQPGAAFTTCATCSGTGQTMREQGAFRIATPCPSCRGARGRWSRDCPACEGRCGERSTVSVKVKVPPGLESGQQLRLAGQGNPRADGSPGHLYLRIEVQPSVARRSYDAALERELAQLEPTAPASTPPREVRVVAVVAALVALALGAALLLTR